MARIFLGYTRPTMRRTTGCNRESGSQSLKSTLSSDCGLQLARMKPESLVSGGHQDNENYECTGQVKFLSINELFQSSFWL